MGWIVAFILNLSGPTAYLLVGLLAFGEAAAFVGLVLPGELAVILGGVVASGGNASLPVMLAVASVAAVAGDSAGFEIGRRFGPRILAWPPFRRRFADKVDRASAYLHEKGGRAVFLGRWTSVLRALVPGIAGMAGMPYARFLVFNVMGGVAWATTFVLLGYGAGASWRQVERIAGRASLLLLVLLLLGWLIRWGTRRLAARADAVRDRLAAMADTRPLRWIRTRFGAPLGWARERLTPGASYGLGWTMSFVIAGLAAWLAGAAVQDLLAREELFLLDRPLAAWIVAHSTPEAVDVAEGFVVALAPPVGAWLVGVAAGVVWRWTGIAAAMRVLVAAGLAWMLGFLVQLWLPATSAGTRFPALAVTWLTATVVSSVAAVGGRDPGRSVRIAGVGATAILVAGAAELVAGTTALSGVLGGLGIGAVIGAGGELTARSVGSSRSAIR